MPPSPLPSDLVEHHEERIHPALTMLLVLAASGMGWALIFAVLFLRTL